MPKVLVVYYSRSGYTRRIATEVAARCGADIEEIRDTRQRSGVWGYFRSGREAMRKERPAIAATTRDPARYDVVVLGTPVWVGSMASPMRSWLTAHAVSLARTAFFCTQGGSHEQKVFGDLAALCAREPIAKLVLSDADIDKRRHADRLQKFVAAIAAGQAKPDSARPAA